MSPTWSVDGDDVATCPLCGHSASDHNDPCDVNEGYDHMNGFTECGCPLALQAEPEQRIEAEPGEAFMVVFTGPTAEWLRQQLRQYPHLRFFPIPSDVDDLPCFGIGPSQEAWDRAKRDGL